MTDTREKIAYDHVRRPVADLVPYARNARLHSDAQISQLSGAIREFGFTNPVLIDENDTIIAGHGRVLAAKKLKMADVPCIIVSGLTDTQRRALVIADNQLSLKASWDQDLLVMELGDLASSGFDLNLAGFDPGDLSALLNGTDLGTEGLTDPDDTPAVPVDAVTKLGDVWILGRHRLMCGDSTNPDHVARLMQGEQADLCFTSPPYGQQRDYTAGIADWDALMQGVFGILPVRDGAQVLVNLGLIHRDAEWVSYWDSWIEWMRSAGWRRFGWYVWDQGPGLPGDWNGRLAPSHEFVFHFNREAERARKTKEKDPRNVRVKSGTGMRREDGTMSGVSSPLAGLQKNKIPDSVIRVMRHKGGLGDAGSHPAPFPVDLPGEFILAFSDPDDIVYEPFCGSGTQLIAAQKNGRTCFGMDIAPQYADVAVKRWQNFTGQQAILEGTDSTFDEVSVERPH